jgi:hypothetical protein
MDLIREWYAKQTVPVEFFLSDLLTIIEQSGEKLEGNSFYYHQSTNRFAELHSKQMNLIWAGSTATKRICEIGFNAGHSALLFSLPNQDKEIEFTVFDLCEHSYTKPCFGYLKNKFASFKFELIEGDSLVKIPKFLEEHPEVIGTYDVVHVDGGHTEECAYNDFIHAFKMVRIGGLIIVDDTNISYIDTLCEKAIQSGKFIEIDCLPTFGYQHRILQRTTLL